MCVEISRATRRAGRLTELNRLEVICVLLGWPGIFHFCMCARSHQHHGAVCTESTIVLCAFSVAIKIVTLVIYAGVTCAAAVMCSLGHCVRNCGNMTSEVKKKERRRLRKSLSRCSDVLEVSACERPPRIDVKWHFAMWHCEKKREIAECEETPGRHWDLAQIRGNHFLPPP